MVKIIPTVNDILPCGRILIKLLNKDEDETEHSANNDVFVFECNDGKIAKLFVDAKKYECESYALHELAGCYGVPQIITEDKFYNDNLPYFIFDNYGKEIEDDELILNYQKVIKILTSIHERGIIHGDIKHENILWNPEIQRATIIDFDRAIKVGEKSKNTFIGTYPYLAPEMIKPCNDRDSVAEPPNVPSNQANSDKLLKAPLSPAIDYFTFGLLLADSLNDRAFNRELGIDYDKMNLTIFGKRLNKLPTFIGRNIDGKFINLIKKMTKFNPAERSLY